MIGKKKTRNTGVMAIFGVFALVFLAANARTTSVIAQEGYGYYEVVGASSLNIRARPYMSSQVLTVAEEGEVLVKWKRFCSLRPWCPVQKGDVQGWAGKDYLYELDD